VKLFLYEFITGGGLLDSAAAELPPSLLCEGRAMVEALAADLAALDGVETVLLSDVRVPLKVPGCRVVSAGTRDEADAAFEHLAAAADWTLLIAPELDGALADCCRRVEQGGGRVLGPTLPVVLLTSDKERTARHLAAAGLPVPEGITLAAGERLPADFRYPAVLKPRHGAGSQHLRTVATPEAARQLGPVPFTMRLERYCSGTAASVAVLCGPSGVHSLVACRQHLSEDGCFRYLGGSLPIEPALADRAERLAVAAVASLPEPRGYLGVDLVLGSCREDDRVIEINPRLTTSYVGLRVAARGNLAEALLRIATGEPADLSFSREPLQFDASGLICRRGDVTR
jgi:predicted ATP-grasp superfamily ATP-dependent carboligase